MDDVSTSRVVSFAEELVRVAPALHTCVRMAYSRGYTVTHVARHGNADAPMTELPQHAPEHVASAAADVFQEPSRHQHADKPLLLLRAVAGPAPRPFSAVAAAGLPPRAELAVVLLAGCNSEAVRDAEAALLERGCEDFDAGAAQLAAVFVSKQKLTTGARQLLERTVAQRFRHVQHFCLARLQAAVTDHLMVPQHVPLTPRQAAAVRARYPGGPLPRLLHDDAVIKFLGVLPDTVVAVREMLGRSEPAATFFEVVQRDAAF